jgi:CelD/BcsL family acetyltransferase involved in cellulose biosynthesis
MNVEIVTSDEGFFRLASEWRQLQKDEGTLPFTSWEWNAVWWKHLARRGLAMADRLYVHTFRDAQGRLLAVAPLMVTSMPAMGPGFRCLQFFGADKNLTEVRGILCRKGYEDTVYAALLDRLFAKRFDRDCFMMSGFRLDGATPALLEKCDGVKYLDVRPDLVLTLPSTWDEFRSTRSRNIKESLRKCANSLKRDGLTPSFPVATGGPELTAFVETMLQLHRARAKSQGGVNHPNVFDTRATRAFLREVSSQMSEGDGVRAFAMTLDGRTVATRLGFSIGRSLYLYYSGYDATFAKYSVMTSVVAEAIKYAIANGYRMVNLSTGIDVSKTRWSPETINYGNAIVPSDAPLAQIATRGYLVLRDAWRAAYKSSARLLPEAAPLSVPPPPR